MEDLEIVCFDCDYVLVVYGEREALNMASAHADEKGHRLIVQRYKRARTTTLWEITPRVEA